MKRTQYAAKCLLPVGLCVVAICLWPADPADSKAPAKQDTPPAKPTTKKVSFAMKRVGTYRSEACGVGDFNNDGKLDIVAGPYWYEAPKWTPHQYRKLRGKVDGKGKGYFDDFANLPLDVDGDGRLDVVTCCWFAKQIDWYRNTGKDGVWPMKVIEKSGNHECGDLVDIDGDGKELEILPVTQATHWYEVGVKPDGTKGAIKHVVSTKRSQWGCGAGDVNGDGRPDILRPNAWFEAPKDPRKGKWKRHPLAVGHQQAGRADHTPQIYAYDVNCDGANDIITSSAHKYGIFWYQQVREGETVTWKQHVIDKSWSQAHAIAMGDVDGDGDLDLVIGKRMFAHNGGDPGANDPPCLYWYELDRGATPKWTRHAISVGKGIGAGLNIPLVDLDGDGDLDIVVTGKLGGPVIFENLIKSAKSADKR